MQYGERKLQKTTEKNVYFPYIDSDLGDFALIMTSELRIKEFPLYGMDNYYKMVGKKSIQKIFFRIERFPFQRSSLFGIFTVPQSFLYHPDTTSSSYCKSRLYNYNLITLSINLEEL